MTELINPEHLPLMRSVRSDVTGADNLMGARNDSEALTLFLNKSGSRSLETRRRYEREIIRFTAYIYQELAIDYAAVRLKHLQTYLHFIQNLPSHWLKPGVLPGKPDKVLFKSSIQPGKSTDQVIDVLSTFFGFLERNRYTLGNPAASLVRSGEKTARGSQVIRYFHEPEWEHVRQCLSSMPSSTHKEVMESMRTSFMIRMTYALALRESELTGQTCNDIHPDNEGGYYLSVLGKGRKRRNLPINPQLHETIKDYRSFYGYTGITGNSLPLAPRRRKSAGAVSGLTSRGLRFWWQGFMRFCAERTDDINLQYRLQEMPFHALRHTALTHLAQKMDIEDLAIFAGHDSINTTSQYYHVEARRLKTLTMDHQL
ncbi:tyrosine-type recombinase/integrase [Endozoicomonas euniceicola]|uniref:Tyrosine-type recombinase/integrase n=1 Tax=Endozoicomonas euniceicola TaxID=1234143 RepID=A0ABY6GSW4_9GAMM|nr:tyrosine-type recombinase/integrase [Endozoicomonas euniceicola]UYM15850.1 tyrosine-type recombinase/integrase [Endozoicomonas euniceicola]